MSNTPSKNMFDRFAPEQMAVVPANARGEMSFQPTRVLIERGRLTQAHWTSQLARWVERQLLKFNPYVR